MTIEKPIITKSILEMTKEELNNCRIKIYNNTILKISFIENLSNSSIKMIKDILKNSLGFKTEIEVLR